MNVSTLHNHTSNTQKKHMFPKLLIKLNMLMQELHQINTFYAHNAQNH